MASDERIPWQCPQCERRYTLKPMAKPPKICPTCRTQTAGQNEPITPQDVPPLLPPKQRKSKRLIVIIVSTLVTVVLGITATTLWLTQPDEPEVTIAFWQPIANGAIHQLVIRIRAPISLLKKSDGMTDNTFLISTTKDDWKLTFADDKTARPIPFFDLVQIKSETNPDKIIELDLQFIISGEKPFATGTLQFRDFPPLQLDSSNKLSEDLELPPLVGIEE